MAVKQNSHKKVCKEMPNRLKGRKCNHKNREVMAEYKKPQVIAKNLPSGSYAAGCPAKDTKGLCLMSSAIRSNTCKKCERTS